MADERARVRVVSAEIQRGGRYLITRRPAHAVLPGLWEFPGGRVREGESDEQALRRALKQRITCGAAVGERLLEVHHSYPDYDLTLAVYRCDLGEAEPACGSVAEVRWVAPEQLTDHAFPGADRATVDLLVRAAE